MGARLEVLKKSLDKKERLFDEKLTNHIDTVKQANGQPLNDKRNGAATFNKWDRQNDALRNIKKGIEKTKNAIQNEEAKIKHVESVRSTLPLPILELIEDKTLTQWRKFPNMFFVNGVDRARIVYDTKKGVIAHRYLYEVTDKEQYSKFAVVYNRLLKSLAML